MNVSTCGSRAFFKRKTLTSLVLGCLHSLTHLLLLGGPRKNTVSDSGNGPRIFKNVDIDVTRSGMFTLVIDSCDTSGWSSYRNLTSVLINTRWSIYRNHTSVLINTPPIVNRRFWLPELCNVYILKKRGKKRVGNGPRIFKNVDIDVTRSGMFTLVIDSCDTSGWSSYHNLTSVLINTRPNVNKRLTTP